MVAGFRRARDSEVRVGMESAQAAHGRKHDRRRPPGAEKLDLRVELHRVHEAAGANLEAAEPLAVGTDRHVAFDSRGEVGEVRRGKPRARQGFEIEYVERLRGRGDLECRELLREGLAHAAQAGDWRQQRTRREKSKEPASLRRTGIVHRPTVRVSNASYKSQLSC
jgi:hypothetical protein